MPNNLHYSSAGEDVLSTLTLFADHPKRAFFLSMIHAPDKELAKILRYLTLIGGHEEIVAMNQSLVSAKIGATHDEIVAGTLQYLHLLYDRLTLLIVEKAPDEDLSKSKYKAALSNATLKELKKLIARFAEKHVASSENKAAFKKLIANKRKIAEAKLTFNLITKDFNLYNVYAAYQDAKYNLEQARLRLAETNAKYVGMDCNAAEIFAVKLAKQAVAKQYLEFLTCLNAYDAMRKVVLQSVRDNMQDNIEKEVDKLTKELAERREKYYLANFGMDMQELNSLSPYEVIYDLDTDFAHKWAIESLQGASSWDDEKKRDERVTKQQLTYFSHFLAAIVCVGEAIVPALAEMGPTGKMSNNTLATMLGAYTVNYMLFVSSILPIFMSLRSGELFTDKKRRTLGSDNFIYNLLAVLVCSSTGLVYACLSFNSTTPMFAKALAALASSSAFAGIPYVIPFAAFMAPVFPAIIALTAWVSFSILYYVPFVGLAKSDDNTPLLSHFFDAFTSYFKSTYIDIWEEDKHWILKLSTFLINLVTMVAVIMLTSFALFNSASMFSNQLGTVLAHVFPWLNITAQSLGTNAITGLAMVTVMPFTAKNVSHYVSTMIHVAVTLVALPLSVIILFAADQLQSPLAADSVIRKYVDETRIALTNFFMQFDNNSLRALTVGFASTFTAIAAYGGVLNAKGQGLVAKSSPRIVAAGLQQPAFYSASIGSLWPNLRALHEQTETVASERRVFIKARETVHAPHALAKVESNKMKYAEANIIQEKTPSAMARSKPAYLCTYRDVKTETFFKSIRAAKADVSLTPLMCEQQSKWLSVQVA